MRVRKICFQSEEMTRKLCSAHSKKKQTQAHSVAVKLPSLMDSGLHTESEVQMQLTLKVFDASLHQDRATMSGSFLFLVHQHSDRKQTGHCVQLLQHAHWQQCCVQAILEPCWAINWFWCKQKWKWGHSPKPPTGVYLEIWKVAVVC